MPRWKLVAQNPSPTLSSALPAQPDLLQETYAPDRSVTDLDATYLGAISSTRRQGLFPGVPE
jgi:hypothetical protein